MTWLAWAQLYAAEGALMVWVWSYGYECRLREGAQPEPASRVYGDAFLVWLGWPLALGYLLWITIADLARRSGRGRR